GGMLYWFPNPLRRVARANIARCLPELDRRARRRLLRRSLIETGRTALEAGHLWALTPARARGLLVAMEGREPVDAAVAAGRGVIIATPHLGSWEMAGQIGGLEWGMWHLYRPPRMPELERVLCSGRARLGARPVRADAGGVRRLLQALREGGVIGILPDQDPGPEHGVMAPFFGIPANTMRLLPRLARTTGAALFIAWCERLPRARGYRIRIRPLPSAAADPDPVIAAGALNRAVEQAVRALPEQYQWSYRRFRQTEPAPSA
ncbi:MAG TPA: lysophospholipid acyltransferase family protein, partial [Thiohalobacter sp.]|nr:lysophospholipid acyltransferase family protein [Thiohalobacter sp.]